MPNWACGSVSITGTNENVQKFVQRFIYECDEGEIADDSITYFARSFVPATRSSTIEKIYALFANKSTEAESTFTLCVNFAWSAHDCLINAPQKFPEFCSIMDACKADGVAAEVKAEECGEGFEEEIHCKKDGNYDSSFRDMQTFICPNCGTSESVPSYGNADERECQECGKKGLIPMEAA